MDRREHTRVPLRMQCRVYSLSQGSMEPWAETVDISRSGVRLCWGPRGFLKAPPAPGDLVQIEVLLPVNNTYGPRCMYFEGAVLRVTESPEDDVLVAVNAHTNELRECRNLQTPSPSVQ